MYICASAVRKRRSVIRAGGSLLVARCSLLVACLFASARSLLEEVGGSKIQLTSI